MSSEFWFCYHTGRFFDFTYANSAFWMKNSSFKIRKAPKTRWFSIVIILWTMLNSAFILQARILRLNLFQQVLIQIHYIIFSGCNVHDCDYIRKAPVLFYLWCFCFVKCSRRSFLSLLRIELYCPADSWHQIWSCCTLFQWACVHVPKAVSILLKSKHRVL